LSNSVDEFLGKICEIMLILKKNGCIIVLSKLNAG